MQRTYLGTVLLILASCTSASGAAIDASDDLHCAVVIRALEKNADRLGATPAAKRGLYVLQTWYFSKVKRERLSEVQRVVDTIRKRPGDVSLAGQSCSNRAFDDPEFSRWKSIASYDYDQKLVR